jgi:hypothetical protein
MPNIVGILFLQLPIPTTISTRQRSRKRDMPTTNMSMIVMAKTMTTMMIRRKTRGRR